ncbi:Rid family detoxifying hydrolase [Photobacterium lipolyticum]|uniref:Reactive intermediate/imine deaminase n=1 Tax=Photobacterium lipolyticum TaxID=266810 RepID=A0A2T3MQP5_9GAMM|nr:Rid family detoxifying hydrolase [Photobacterium lipolyticum]PSV99443.1 reactive intermediate/imine deaminase [Photobacterium lipolyticum]
MVAIKTPRAPEAIGPYVQGVNLGDLVITSGQLPINPETKAMPEDVADQATQSLKNALAIVKEAGLNANNIVKTTVFVKDLNDFSRVNEAYEAFFNNHDATFPARSCVEVARLPLDAKIEIEVIASR